MTNKGYKRITAFLFLVIAVVHGLRLAFGWQVIIHNIQIPMWISVVAVVLALTLACYGWQLGREEKKKRK